MFQITSVVFFQDFYAGLNGIYTSLKNDCGIIEFRQLFINFGKEKSEYIQEKIKTFVEDQEKYLAADKKQRV
jgi:hypothetical protein